MKSELTTLQVELREIEKRITKLHNMIEKMKPKIDNNYALDFEEINKLASRKPIINTSFLETSIEIKQIIFKSLSGILLLDFSDTPNIFNGILYIERLAKGCRYDISSEEIYTIGKQYNISDLEEILKLSAYKYAFLAEIIIMFNVLENIGCNHFKIIGDISQILNVKKDELRIIALIAKSVILNDFKMISSLSSNNSILINQLKHYIPEDWIEQCRVCCARIPIKKLCNLFNVGFKPYIITNEIIERKITGNFVREGDVLLKYNDTIANKNLDYNDILRWDKYGLDKDKVFTTNKRTIKAPCNGIVFFYPYKVNSELLNQNDLIFKHPNLFDIKNLDKHKDEYAAIYVVSIFDDYDKFCSWCLNKQNL